MSDQQPGDQATADAIARLQDAHAQYLTAMQDVWTTIFKGYNESMAAFIKTQQEQLQAQQEQLKNRACQPQSEPPTHV